MTGLRFIALLPMLVLGLGTAQAAEIDAATFVAKAGAGDLYEQQSSKLVLASTKNAKVRSFAQTMVTDHAKTTAEVKAAATKAGLKPKPPTLDSAKVEMVADLKAANGKARDKLYIEQQKIAHDEALTLHRSYSTSGTSAPLKTVAAKAVPIVQHHLHMLQTM
jgi:putative membrane protein